MSLAETLPHGIWIGDGADGRPLYCNTAFAELMGVRPIPETRAGSFARAFRLRDLQGRPYPEHELPCQRAAQDGEPKVVEDLVVHRPDGVQRMLRCSSHPIYDSSGKIAQMLLFFEDITDERREAAAREEEALRSRREARMDAVGQLASGLALDLNHLLATAQILVTTLKMSEQDPVRREDLGQVQDALSQAVHITRTLKNFGVRRRDSSTRVLIPEVVEAVAELVRRVAPAELEIEVERLAGRDAVEGDAGGIERALWALAMNAKARMPNGGRLTLRTSDLLLGGQDAMRRPPLQPGWHVVIDVIDTGPPREPAVRERMFEPYLSGAPAAGLGLATAYGTFRSHRGTLDVVDTQDGRSALRVLLPAAQRPTDLSPPPSVRRGSGRVLVVDGDPRVLGATGSALQELGYEVRLAQSGAEALAIFQGEGAEAAIVELVMPEMDGLQTMAKLRAMDPAVRVLLTTGLEADELPAARRTIQRYLRKPFGIEELSSALAGLML